MKQRKIVWLLVILALSAALCGCSRAQEEELVYQKLLTAFADAGYPAVLEELPAETQVPIYNASVWKALKAGEDTVLVYFDESNRADYLLTMFDQTPYGYATHVGQRFILCYGGANEELTTFLKSLE